MSTIKSKIAVSKFTLTTDNEVRSRIWDLLNPYRDVIWFEGPNKTQLEFGSNPGGNTQDALAIVVVHIYIAQKNDLIQIWSQDRASQFKAVNKLAKELGWTLEKPTLMKWLEDAVIKYVVHAATKIITRRVENMRYGFNTDVIWKRWQAIVTGYQRLSTLDSSCTFLTAQVWQERLDRVKELAAILEADYRLIVELDAKIEALREQAKALEKAFDTQADKVEGLTDLDLLMVAFTSTKEELVKIEESIKAIQFDEQPSREAVKEAKMLVPAEAS